VVDFPRSPYNAFFIHQSRCHHYHFSVYVSVLRNATSPLCPLFS
jgi:hypothetical protein